ncbi:helix-turn-helix transcriptional regulator [Neorhizobium sp. T6_25]|uniref:helix-turn-helix domain-containing protein n=1 Tax=Neorhizobium sp. T6_25 TaxID=2093833 RepID=UPI000CF8A44D|nr:helix-turn-helix transcriptional regulator [Neorhizobium sp. T6_25]
MPNQISEEASSERDGPSFPFEFRCTFTSGFIQHVDSRLEFVGLLYAILGVFQVYFGGLCAMFDRPRQNRSSVDMSTILTPQLSKAARGLLDWSQEELSEKAGVGLRSVSRFESKGGTATPVVRQKLYEAFKQGGIEFIASNSMTKDLDGLGLRFRPLNPNDGIKII